MTTSEFRHSRLVERILLCDEDNEFSTVESALSYLNKHSTDESPSPFKKHIVVVSFSNGDHVEGSFASKQKARDFIQFVTSQ